MRIKRTDGFNTDNVVPIRPGKRRQAQSSEPTAADFEEAVAALNSLCGGGQKSYFGPLFQIQEIRQAVVKLLCESMDDCPDPRVKVLQRLVQNA